jgi:hypothetical protein
MGGVEFPHRLFGRLLRPFDRAFGSDDREQFPSLDQDGDGLLEHLGFTVEFPEQVLFRENRLQRSDPDVAAAVEYLTAGTPGHVADAVALREGPAALRSRVEAYLMAKVDPTDAATRLGLEAATVAAYAALFFDLDGRRDLPSVLLNVAFPGEPHPSESVRDANTVVKLVGMGGGRFVLDFFLAHCDRPQPAVPDDLRGLPDDELEATKNWLTVRLMVLGETVEVRSSADIIKLAKIRLMM